MSARGRLEYVSFMAVVGAFFIISPPEEKSYVDRKAAGGRNKNIKSNAKRCYALLTTESEGNYSHAMPEL
jgi:hypothetical protein